MFFQCGDRALAYGERVLVMGIVNVTPDSFSDGGDYFDVPRAVARVREMDACGTDIIDLGAQSTRPGSQKISPKEELSRLLPVLQKIGPLRRAVLSVDTFYPEVAAAALQAGVRIVNDVSGNVCREMADVVRAFGAGWILMHPTGEKSDIVGDVRAFFAGAADRAAALGVRRESLCFDPGIGFGKTREEDLALIANVHAYKPDGFPLLFAASRKRVIGYASGEEDPKKRTPGGIAANTAAVLGGADIVRVHDPEIQIPAMRMAGEIRKRVKK